jgi:hypothetical protein
MKSNFLYNSHFVVVINNHVKSFLRFLLPYERNTKGLEEKKMKRRESDSGSEKVDFPHKNAKTLDFINEFFYISVTIKC